MGFRGLEALYREVRSDPGSLVGTQIIRNARTLRRPRILYHVDKYAIRPIEAKRIREFLAQVDARQGSIELVGHCDSRGTNLYNLTLGLNRSKSVKRFIEQELGSNHIVGVLSIRVGPASALS